MPLPLIHLLEPPLFHEGDKGSFDNELKLWGMLKQLRTGLVGQGGPLSGWGFSSGDDGAGVGGIAGEVVYLGAFGQLTVDGTCLLFEDSTNKRVGVNTCAPQYPLDINSNECDSKIIAIRNGNADADADMFANYDAAPGARVRLSRADDGVNDPTFQLRFYTNEDVAGVSTLNERLSLSRVVNIKSGFALSGHISPAQITATQNNYDPTGLESAAVLHLTSNASQQITGLARGFDGNIKYLHNSGTQDIILVHESAGSSTFNRFKLGANITVPAGASITLFYDGHISRWITIAGGTTGGSGIANRIAYWVTPNVLGPVNAINPGEVMFADANGLPDGHGNLFWDSTNFRFRISLNPSFAPLNGLELQGGGAGGDPWPSTFAIYNINDPGTVSARIEGYKWHINGLLVNHPLISIRGGGNNADSPTGRSIQGRMEVRAAETWGATARGTYITLETTPLLSTTMAQRFVVGPAGQWGIGGTVLADTVFGTSGQVFTSGGAGAAPTWTTPGTGVTDHGALTGLGDDDHTIYLLLAGRAGGQTANGGTAASDKLILHSTSNVTKGDIDLHAADITHLAASKHRMAGQNRFRYLNSSASVTKTSNQSLNNATVTKLTWDSASFDTDTIFDNANDRLVAKLTGKYLVGGVLNYASSGAAGGSRQLRLNLNGANIRIANGTGINSDNTFVFGLWLVSANATDFFEISGYQDSGGALNVVSALPGTHFFCTYVGE